MMELIKITGLEDLVKKSGQGDGFTSWWKEVLIYLLVKDI